VGLVTIDAQPVLQKGNDACRTSYITNALDRNERMSFIQKQVGHTTTRMIVDHYYRHEPAPDDGDRLEEAWNSTTLLPPSEDADFQVSEKKV
jgi:integrase